MQNTNVDKVTIAKVSRNLPDEKCLEIIADNGTPGYLESCYDPRTNFTTTTMYLNGISLGSSRSTTPGNDTTIVMNAAFNMLPSLVEKPEFLA